MTDLVHAADQSQSKLPDRQSEIRVLKETLLAKTDAEEKEEKKMLDRDMDDIGEGSARGTVRGDMAIYFMFLACVRAFICNLIFTTGIPHLTKYM